MRKGCRLLVKLSTCFHGILTRYRSNSTALMEKEARYKYIIVGIQKFLPVLVRRLQKVWIRTKST